MVFKMKNENAKLQIGDIFVVNTEEYFGLKSGKYKVSRISKTRLGAPIYKVKHNRKNAVTEYSVYVNDLDRDMYEPKIEDLTCTIGLSFLNFKSVVMYNEELIAEAKRINSER